MRVVAAGAPAILSHQHAAHSRYELHGVRGRGMAWHSPLPPPKDPPLYLPHTPPHTHTLTPTPIASADAALTERTNLANRRRSSTRLKHVTRNTAASAPKRKPVWKCAECRDLAASRPPSAWLPTATQNHHPNAPKQHPKSAQKIHTMTTTSADEARRAMHTATGMETRVRRMLQRLLLCRSLVSPHHLR
jgi:hypothetical protein